MGVAAPAPENYDEAAEWRDALQAYSESSPGQELAVIANALVMAASVAMSVAPEARRQDGAFQEKVGEARTAWHRVNSMFCAAEWQGG